MNKSYLETGLPSRNDISEKAHLLTAAALKIFDAKTCAGLTENAKSEGARMVLKVLQGTARELERITGDLGWKGVANSMRNLELGFKKKVLPGATNFSTGGAFEAVSVRPGTKAAAHGADDSRDVAQAVSDVIAAVWRRFPANHGQGFQFIDRDECPGNTADELAFVQVAAGTARQIAERSTGRDREVYQAAADFISDLAQ